MNWRFWLDAVLGTTFIFFLIGFILNLSVLGIFDVFDPIGHAISDLEITDLVFSQLREEPPADTNIVMVNIGNLSRGEMAAQIHILQQYNPKVIGIDAVIEDPTVQDAEGNLMLAGALALYDNIVLVSRLTKCNDVQCDSMEYSLPMFSAQATNAYANLITADARAQDHFKTCRTFRPQQATDTGQVVHFGVKLASLYDSAAAADFLTRKKVIETINYRGNIPSGNSSFSGRFSALDWQQVFEQNFVPEFIEGKVVIMGYLGSDFSDNSWEDKFFTPLNKEYAGRTNPDMFGAVIHANIVSMILNRDYVYAMPNWLALVVAVVLCFLNVVLFSVIYRRLPNWYDGLTKLIQLFEALLLIAVLVWSFHWFNWKLDLTPTFAAVLLAGDALEVYYGVLKNLFSASGRKELFRIRSLKEYKALKTA